MRHLRSKRQSGINHSQKSSRGYWVKKEQIDREVAQILSYKRQNCTLSHDFQGRACTVCVLRRLQSTEFSCISVQAITYLAKIVVPKSGDTIGICNVTGVKDEVDRIGLILNKLSQPARINSVHSTSIIVPVDSGLADALTSHISNMENAQRASSH